MTLTLTPADAWQPLPASEWNEDAARHLLRRVGWTAEPPEVARLMKDGLEASLARLFPAKANSMPPPPLITTLQADMPDIIRRIRDADSPEQRRLIQRERREREQQAVRDLSIKWLQFASLPENSATEKWMLFLSNVYVVSVDKVDNPVLIYNFQGTLRDGSLGSDIDLAKTVSRTPAMMRYLDLQDSRIGDPNENFARELLELFLLGQGNGYTEHDIKEAARAYTGYRLRDGQFFFAPGQHDTGMKTFLGQTGPFVGDDIIDIAFQQPAAGTHLPYRMSKFYLTEEGLPPEYLATLGPWWKNTGYNLGQLTRRFFGSRIFFDPAFRGNFVKSPIQLYLSLIQDLNLDVAPFTYQTLNSLRLMGQVPFYPPNVGGWVGGRLWINSGTLEARRQLVQTLFTPINEAYLNADQQVQLVAARAAGQSHFAVTNARLAAMLQGMSNAQIADRFLDYFLPVKVDAFYRSTLLSFLDDPTAAKNRIARLRDAAMTVLDCPEYQLC